MRLLVALLLACAVRADTVVQLVGKVRDGLAAGRADAEMAEAVAGTRLTERLEDAVIEALGAGPLTTEALETARDSSERLPRAAAIRLFDPPPAPSREEQMGIVEHGRVIALEYSASLPNFICTETVRRYQAHKGTWALGDTLLIDVASNGRQESYHVLSVNGRATEKPFRSLGGFKASGEFDTFQRMVFREQSHAAFTWERWTRLRGRLAHVFAYRIDQEHSEYRIDFRSFLKRYTGVTAVRGLVYLDAETHKLLRLTLEGDHFPAKWPVQRTSTVLDYDFAEVAGASYLLPRRSDSRAVLKEAQNRNVTEFGNYRRFSAEATLNFEK